MNIDFAKSGGLVPVVIQDTLSLQVLMVGYMNEEALNKTHEEGKVTFFSRSKNRLWTKGETSGNWLLVDEILTDCDNDAPHQSLPTRTSVSYRHNILLRRKRHQRIPL